MITISNDERVLRHSGLLGILNDFNKFEVPQGALCWFPHHTLVKMEGG